MQNHTYSTHRMIRKTLICALFLAAAMLPAQQAHAFVNATSTTRNIAINRTVSVRVTWKIVVAVGAATQVSSTQATFNPIPAGPSLLTVSRTIGGLTTPGIPNINSSTLTVSETILIPASVIAKARAAGAKQISYERSFTPGGKGGVIFNITGSAGAGFNISREALSFTDK